MTRREGISARRSNKQACAQEGRACPLRLPVDRIFQNDSMKMADNKICAFA